MPSLDQEIALLHSGDHLCLPYADDDEQIEPLTSFARHGLTRGEQFLFVGPRPKLDALLARLDGAGIDTRRALDRGAITHAAPGDFYRADGRFDVEERLEAIANLAESAQRAGFAGLRGASDIVTLEAGDELTDAMVEYETRLTKEMRRQPMIAMCQFDRRRVPANTLLRVLCAHPMALAGGHVCVNPYYEPAVVLDEPDRDAMRLEWMLRQIDRSHREGERQESYAQSLASQAASLILEVGQRRRSEEELARVLQNRDAFLSLVSEAMGAALRSMRGDLSMLAQEAPAHAARPLAHLAFLETIADQMHEVGRVPGRRALKASAGDLAEIVRECVARHQEDLADTQTSLRVAADQPIRGRWDRARIDQLLDSLMARAIRCAHGAPVHVAAEPDGPDRGRIVVRIQTVPPGAPVAPREHRPDAAPTPSAETARNAAHSQAFEATVWLPRTLAEAMNGALIVIGNPLVGEEIVVELPSAAASSAEKPGG